MIIGIWGPSAVGKTRFIENNMDAIADVCIHPLTIAWRETGSGFWEYELDELDGGSWEFQRVKDRWVGDRASKIGPWIDDMVGGDRLWIVETMRYFNGLDPEYIAAYKRCHGGLRFIIPYYDGATGLAMRQARCDLKGKAISPYWTEDSCWGESKYRLNVAARYADAGVTCRAVDIDLERKHWDRVKKILLDWVQEPKSEWYECRTNKGS